MAPVTRNASQRIKELCQEDADEFVDLQAQIRAATRKFNELYAGKHTVQQLEEQFETVFDLATQSNAALLNARKLCVEDKKFDNSVFAKGWGDLTYAKMPVRAENEMLPKEWRERLSTRVAHTPVAR